MYCIKLEEKEEILNSCNWFDSCKHILGLFDVLLFASSCSDSRATIRKKSRQKLLPCRQQEDDLLYRWHQHASCGQLWNSATSHTYTPTSGLWALVRRPPPPHTLPVVYLSLCLRCVLLIWPSRLFLLSVGMTDRNWALKKYTILSMLPVWIQLLGASRSTPDYKYVSQLNLIWQCCTKRSVLYRYHLVFSAVLYTFKVLSIILSID